MLDDARFHDLCSQFRRSSFVIAERRTPCGRSLLELSHCFEEPGINGTRGLARAYGKARRRLIPSKPMTASDFRTLAARCRRAARDCFDLFAKEEFRRLAQEFDGKAAELEFLAAHQGQRGWWARRAAHQGRP
jgi:hypothetical protein